MNRVPMTRKDWFVFGTMMAIGLGVLLAYNRPEVQSFLIALRRQP